MPARENVRTNGAICTLKKKENRMGSSNHSPGGQFESFLRRINYVSVENKRSSTSEIDFYFFVYVFQLLVSNSVFRLLDYRYHP